MPPVRGNSKSSNRVMSIKDRVLNWFKSRPKPRVQDDAEIQVRPWTGPSPGRPAPGVFQVPDEDEFPDALFISTWRPPAPSNPRPGVYRVPDESDFEDDDFEPAPHHPQSGTFRVPDEEEEAFYRVQENFPPPNKMRQQAETGSFAAKRYVDIDRISKTQAACLETAALGRAKKMAQRKRKEDKRAAAAQGASQRFRVGPRPIPRRKSTAKDRMAESVTDVLRRKQHDSIRRQRDLERWVEQSRAERARERSIEDDYDQQAARQLMDEHYAAQARYGNEELHDTVMESIEVDDTPQRHHNHDLDPHDRLLNLDHPHRIVEEDYNQTVREYYQQANEPYYPFGPIMDGPFDFGDFDEHLLSYNEPIFRQYGDPYLEDVEEEIEAEEEAEQEVREWHDRRFGHQGFNLTEEEPRDGSLAALEHDEESESNERLSSDLDMDVEGQPIDPDSSYSTFADLNRLPEELENLDRPTHPEVPLPVEVPVHEVPLHQWVIGALRRVLGLGERAATESLEPESPTSSSSVPNTPPLANTAQASPSLPSSPPKTVPFNLNEADEEDDEDEDNDSDDSEDEDDDDSDDSDDSEDMQAERIVTLPEPPSAATGFVPIEIPDFVETVPVEIVGMVPKTPSPNMASAMRIKASVLKAPSKNRWLPQTPSPEGSQSPPVTPTPAKPALPGKPAWTPFQSGSSSLPSPERTPTPAKSPSPFKLPSPVKSPRKSKSPSSAPTVASYHTAQSGRTNKSYHTSATGQSGGSFRTAASTRSTGSLRSPESTATSVSRQTTESTQTSPSLRRTQSSRTSASRHCTESTRTTTSRPSTESTQTTTSDHSTNSTQTTGIDSGTKSAQTAASPTSTKSAQTTSSHRSIQSAQTDSSYHSAYERHEIRAFNQELFDLLIAAVPVAIAADWQDGDRLPPRQTSESPELIDGETMTRLRDAIYYAQAYERAMTFNDRQIGTHSPARIISTARSGTPRSILGKRERSDDRAPNHSSSSTSSSSTLKHDSVDFRAPKKQQKDQEKVAYSGKTPTEFSPLPSLSSANLEFDETELAASLERMSDRKVPRSSSVAPKSPAPLLIEAAISPGTSRVVDDEAGIYEERDDFDEFGGLHHSEDEAAPSAPRAQFGHRSPRAAHSKARTSPSLDRFVSVTTPEREIAGDSQLLEETRSRRSSRESAPSPPPSEGAGVSPTSQHPTTTAIGKPSPRTPRPADQAQSQSQSATSTAPTPAKKGRRKLTNVLATPVSEGRVTRSQTKQAREAAAAAALLSGQKKRPHYTGKGTPKKVKKRSISLEDYTPVAKKRKTAATPRRKAGGRGLKRKTAKSPLAFQDDDLDTSLLEKKSTPKSDGASGKVPQTPVQKDVQQEDDLDVLPSPKSSPPATTNARKRPRQESANTERPRKRPRTQAARIAAGLSTTSSRSSRSVVSDDDLRSRSPPKIAQKPFKPRLQATKIAAGLEQ